MGENAVHTVVRRNHGADHWPLHNNLNANQYVGYALANIVEVFKIRIYDHNLIRSLSIICLLTDSKLLNFSTNFSAFTGTNHVSYRTLNNNDWGTYS